MARVVCQVLAGPERLTFLWSDGTAPFEPYHKTGENFRAFHTLLRQADERLRELAAATDAGTGAGIALAQGGHELHQALFRADAPQAEAAAAVRAWFTGLARDGAVERLEILTDAPSLIPWTVLHEGAPDEHSFHVAAGTPQAWQGFWATHHGLTVDRRVSPLRTRSVLDNPAVLLAFDPALRQGLPEEQRKQLHDLGQGENVRLVEGADALVRALEDNRPDFLYLLCGVTEGGVVLGGQALAAARLRELLRKGAATEEGRSDTLVMLNACLSSGDAAVNVAGLLEALGTRAGIAPRTALPVAFADHFGLEFLTGFLKRGERLGKLLGELAARTAPLGLLYTAYGPGAFRIAPALATTAVQAEGTPPPDLSKGAEGDEEGPEPLPLPERPYRPLTPYQAADRPLFVGREGDTETVAELLDEAGVRVVLLHGASGVGKASLLRAGVVPYLEEECPGFHVLDDRAEGEEGESGPLVIRATNDLASQLAFALSAFCASPYRYTTPAGKEVVVDLRATLTAALGGAGARPPAPAPEAAIQQPETGLKSADEGGSPPPLPPSEALDEEAIRVALERRPDLAGRALAALAERLPHDLVVVIDRGEEIVSLARKWGGKWTSKSLAILRGLARGPSRARLLVALRSEYLGPVAQALLEEPEERAGVRTYLLPALDREALLEAVLLPTTNEPIPGAAEVPWLKYVLSFEEGVAEHLVEGVLKAAREDDQPVLPLLQARCDQLYRRALGRGERVVSERDLRQVTTVPSWREASWLGSSQAGSGAAAGQTNEKPQTFLGSATNLAAYLNCVLSRLFRGKSSRDRAAFERILQELYFRRPDGSLTADLVPEADLAEHWRRPRPLEDVLLEASEGQPRLVEVDWLNIGGREGRYVSLAHDVLGPANVRRSEERQKGAYGRGLVDTLWIMIPLLLLVGVFAWTRMRTVWAMQKQHETDVLGQKATHQATLTELKGTRWPLYTAQLAQAQAALRLGDPLRARQYLQMQWPPVKEGEDNRSFEWYYLMRQLQTERHNLLGHRGTVAAVALSPDGKLLASAGQDGDVRLWDAVKGQINATLKGHKTAINAVAFAPDGKTLASASAGENGSVLLWDATAGQDGKYVADAKPRTTLSGHKGAVMALAYAPDGKTLASASMDRTIRLWDVAAKEKIQARATLDNPKAPVLALAYAPDGKTLTAGDADGGVKLWDVSAAGKEKERASLDGHGGPVQAVAYAPDGKTLATAAREKKDGLEVGAVRLWDPDKGKERVALTPVPATVWALAFSADGKTLATGGKDDAVHLWDAATGTRRGVLYGHVGWVRSVVFSKDGQTLASGGFDAAVKVWEASGPLSPEVLRGHKDWVNAVAFAPKDKWLASAGADGAIKLWDPVSGKEEKTLTGHKGAVLGLAFSPDGMALASAGADKTVRLWDLDPQSKNFAGELAVLKGHAGAVQAVAYAATGKAIAAGDDEGNVLLWLVDPSEGKEAFGKKVGTIRARGPVRTVVFLPTAPLLVTAGDDRGLQVWNLGEDKGSREPLAGHTAEVRGLAFWPGTDKYVVSCAADRTLRLWDVVAGKEVATLRGHVNGVNAVAMGAGDPPLCVSGGMDGLVKLWHPQLGERFTLTGHSGAVQSVAISSDRRTIAAGGRDGTVRLWRAAAEQQAVQHP